MPPVPQKLHFISPYFYPTGDNLTTLFEWGLLNPEYPTHLWVSPETRSSSFEHLKQHMAHAYPEFTVTLHKEDGHYVFTLYRIVEVERQRTLPPMREEIEEETEHYTEKERQHVMTLHFRSLEEIPPMCDPELIETMYYKFEKPHIVRDMLSLWVLFREGGIYLDYDVHPISPLPLMIDAPRGVLLPIYRETMPVLVNNLIAASLKATDIVSLHSQFEEHYRANFRPEKKHDFLLNTNQSTRFRIKKDIEERHAEYTRLEKFGLDYAKEKDELDRRYYNVYEAAGIGTEHETTAIREWIEAKFPFDEDTIAGTDDRYSTELAHYMFQRVTGCQLRLPPSSLGLQPNKSPLDFSVTERPTTKLPQKSSLQKIKESVFGASQRKLFKP